MEAWSWVQNNFMGVLNAAGVIGSLLFTAFSFRDTKRERELGNLIALTEAHREIWLRLQSDGELARILDKNVDATMFPATAKEEMFVTSLILHLYCAYRSIRRGMYPKLEGLRRDIREFYSLPIPSQIWERLKLFQDRDFVSFVEEALRT